MSGRWDFVVENCMDGLWDNLYLNSYECNTWDGYHLGFNGPTIKSYREGNSHYLSSNVPGLKKEELSVKVENSILTISAKTKKENKTRTKYEFTKQYVLPDNIEIGANDIEAVLEDGVLLIKFKGFYKEIEPPEKKEFEIHIK